MHRAEGFAKSTNPSVIYSFLANASSPARGAKRAHTTPLFYYYTEFYCKSKLYVFVQKGENFAVE